MTHLRTFGRFWYDLIIGDDWRLALGVTLSIALACTIPTPSSTPGGCFR